MAQKPKPKKITSIARVREENPVGSYFVQKIMESNDPEEQAYPFEGKVIKLMGLRKGDRIKVTYERIRSNT